MADQMQSIPPLVTRLTTPEWWGKTVLPAAKIAVARRNGKIAPADQGRIISEEVHKIKTSDRYPMFYGDIVALGLSGFIRHPDPADLDAIRQIEDELTELKKRHSDKPPHAYPPKDAIGFYELMTRLDAGINNIDNSPSCTGIILDRKAENRVRAFSFLRRAVGITRSGHYREGDKLKQADDLMRINQDGVRMLLAMYEEHMRSMGKPVTSAAAEAVLSEEENQFIGNLVKAAQQETARRGRSNEEWAYELLSLWLADREPDDDEGPSGVPERINALKDEVNNLTDAVSRMEADVKGTTNTVMKQAGQIELTRLRNELQKKTDELALLVKPAVNGAKTNSTTTPRPGDGAPMPGAPRITVTTETGEKSVEEGIAEVTAQLESQRTAAANYAADVERLYAEATGHMMKQEMKEATQKLNQATQAQASATTANEQVIKLEARLTELEELKTKGAQPAVESEKKEDKQKPEKKVKLSGRKASAAARAAGKAELEAAAKPQPAVTPPAATKSADEAKPKRVRGPKPQKPAEPVSAAPGAVTPNGKLDLIKAIKAKTDELGADTVKNLNARISAGEDLAAVQAEFEAMTS